MKLFRLLFGLLFFASLVSCGNDAEGEQASASAENADGTPKKEQIKVDFELNETAKLVSLNNEKLVMESGDELDVPYSEDYTTILMVKHGDKNPEKKKLILPEEAQKLADKLKEVIGEWKFDAGYGFDQSANQTIRPISRENKASFSVYTGDNQETFLQHIVENNKGKKVLLVGTEIEIRQLLTLLEGKQQVQSGIDEMFLVFANDIGTAKVNRMKF